jgi:hypothetical protein
MLKECGRSILLLFSIKLLMAGPNLPLAARANVVDDIKAGFDYRIKLHAGTTLQAPANSSQNPGDNYLNIPSFMGNAQIRPDFFLTFRHFDLALNPGRYLRSLDGPKAAMPATVSPIKGPTSMNGWRGCVFATTCSPPSAGKTCNGARPISFPCPILFLSTTGSRIRIRKSAVWIFSVWFGSRI